MKYLTYLDVVVTTCLNTNPILIVLKVWTEDEHYTFWPVPSIVGTWYATKPNRPNGTLGLRIVETNF